jgi:phage-related protein
MFRVIERLQAIPVYFWASETGHEPVREFLQTFEKPDRHRLGADIRRLQFGWPIGMPLVRNLGRGLWELRSTLPGRREVRIVFAAERERLILLHVFFKKTSKTDQGDLALARQRLKDLKR